MERCQSGLMCALGKRVCGNAPQVRILSFPPKETHTKQIERFVSYFYLWNFFGFVVNFERPKIDNTGKQKNEMNEETSATSKII